jgi:phytoene synthase
LIGRKPIVDRALYSDRMSQLFYYRKKLSTAYDGRFTSTDPIFVALKDTVSKYQIPINLLHGMINGMEHDFHQNRYETFDDLYAYCHDVASTVGLVCLHIYECKSPEAVGYAKAWGLFMQLTNIIRDVKEDAERDRIYLPLELLRRHGISESDVKDGETLLGHSGWKGLVTEYAQKVEAFRDEAFKLIPLLETQYQYSPATMIYFYDAVLKKIVAREGDVFTERVQLSKAEKIFLSLYLFARYRMFSFLS